MDPLGLAGLPVGAIRRALKKVYEKIGGPLPKGKPGKFGSPQRGDSKKGYRLDKEGHPNSKDPNEKGPHINYWDYTKGKRKSGGTKGAEPIVLGTIVGIVGSMLDPFDAISGELSNPEEDADGNGISDYLENSPCRDDKCQ